MTRRRRANGGRDTGPLFPPAARTAVLADEGQLALRYTVPRSLRRGPPTHPTPLLGTGLIDNRLIALTLGVDGRLRFVRTGFGVWPREAATDVTGLLGHKYWTIRLSWDEQSMTIVVSADSSESRHADSGGTRPSR